MRLFWLRVTEGRETDHLWTQFAAAARASYEFYDRDVDWEETQTESSASTARYPARHGLRKKMASTGGLGYRGGEDGFGRCLGARRGLHEEVVAVGCFASGDGGRDEGAGNRGAGRRKRSKRQ